MSIATEHGRKGHCTVTGPDGAVLASSATFVAVVRPDGAKGWRLAFGDASGRDMLEAVAVAVRGFAVLAMAEGNGLGVLRDVLSEVVDGAVMEAGRQVAQVGRDKVVGRK